jgi:hypothetical protein
MSPSSGGFCFIGVVQLALLFLGQSVTLRSHADSHALAVDAQSPESAVMNPGVAKGFDHRIGDEGVVVGREGQHRWPLTDERNRCRAVVPGGLHCCIVAGDVRRIDVLEEAILHSFGQQIVISVQHGIHQKD